MSSSAGLGRKKIPASKGKADLSDRRASPSIKSVEYQSPPDRSYSVWFHIQFRRLRLKSVEYQSHLDPSLVVYSTLSFFFLEGFDPGFYIFRLKWVPPLLKKIKHWLRFLLKGLKGRKPRLPNTEVLVPNEGERSFFFGGDHLGSKEDWRMPCPW